MNLAFAVLMRRPIETWESPCTSPFLGFTQQAQCGHSHSINVLSSQITELQFKVQQVLFLTTVGKGSITKLGYEALFAQFWVRRVATDAEYITCQWTGAVNAGWTTGVHNGEVLLL